MMVKSHQDRVVDELVAARGSPCSKAAQAHLALAKLHLANVVPVSAALFDVRVPTPTR